MPTVNTFTSVIDACGKIGDLDQAEAYVHKSALPALLPQNKADCQLKAASTDVESLNMMPPLRSVSCWRAAQCLHDHDADPGMLPARQVATRPELPAYASKDRTE